MKILITTDWYKSAVNGVVTSVRNLEKGLRKQGHDVKILTLSENRSSYAEDNVTYIGSLNAEKIYPSARIKIPLKSSLVKNINTWKPDVIHSQCEFSTFSLAKSISAVCGAPIIHTYHTIYEDYTHYFSPSIRLGRNAVKLFTRHISKYTSCMIVPTHKVKDILAAYRCDVPVEIIPSGLDFEEIQSDSDASERMKLRKSLNIPDENKIILYVGRLAAEKNLDEIIKYLGKAKPQNASFLVVGDGPCRKQLEQKIKSCGLTDSTVFTGMVSPDLVKDYYALGDVFVSASQSETQGLTYIEALANGVPLLCRSDPCLDDVLLDGLNGFSFKAEQDFIKHLEFLLGSDTSEIRRFSRNFAEENFSLDNFAERAAEIYARYAISGIIPIRA